MFKEKSKDGHKKRKDAHILARKLEIYMVAVSNPTYLFLILKYRQVATKCVQ